MVLRSGYCFLLWLGSSWKSAIGFLVMISFFSWMLFTEVWSVGENVCTSLYVCYTSIKSLPTPTHTPKQNSFHVPQPAETFPNPSSTLSALCDMTQGISLPPMARVPSTLSHTCSAGTSLGPCFSSSSLNLFLCWKCHLLYEASLYFLGQTDLSWAVFTWHAVFPSLRALSSLCLHVFPWLVVNSAVAGTVSHSPL